MNADLNRFLHQVILKKGIGYNGISIKTGIPKDRLIEIFNYGSIMSASEWLCLCKFLNISQAEMMVLIGRGEHNDI